MTVFDLVIIGVLALMAFSVGTRRGSGNSKARDHVYDRKKNVDRIRQMQEWDRISHGEDKNRK